MNQSINTDSNNSKEPQLCLALQWRTVAGGGQNMTRLQSQHGRVPEHCLALLWRTAVGGSELSLATWRSPRLVPQVSR